AGWGSARTLLSFAGVIALLRGFAAIEQHARRPLVRLGILRSRGLVRANLGAMAVIGGWYGAQFISTLYMQQLRGWSPIETAFAFLPAGLIVAFGAPRAGKVVDRVGTTRPVVLAMLSFIGAYVLLHGVALDSTYASAILPPMVLVGL